MRSVSQVVRGTLATLSQPSVLVRLALVVAVAVFLVRPLAARVGAATEKLEAVDPWLTALGFLLQVVSLLCYSVMTKYALDDERDAIGLGRLFRIQLVSRAVSSTVPGGAAAGPAAGYRLMATAGISGRNASASLASASVTSAFVLNLLLWAALIVSVPLYGFNAIYAAAALLGIVLMLLVAGVFVAIVDGSALVERPVRFVARRIGSDGDIVTGSIRSFGEASASSMGLHPHPHHLRRQPRAGDGCRGQLPRRPVSVPHRSRRPGVRQPRVRSVGRSPQDHGFVVTRSTRDLAASGRRKTRSPKDHVAEPIGGVRSDDRRSHCQARAAPHHCWNEASTLRSTNSTINPVGGSM